MKINVKVICCLFLLAKPCIAQQDYIQPVVPYDIETRFGTAKTDTIDANKLAWQIAINQKGYPEADWMGYYKVPNIGKESTHSQVIHSAINPKYYGSDPLLAADIRDFWGRGLGGTLGMLLLFMIPLKMIWSINKKNKIKMLFIANICSLLAGFIPSLFAQISALIWLGCLMYAIKQRKKWRIENVAKTSPRKRN